MIAGRMHDKTVQQDDALGIARINGELAKLTRY
jgi:hypothetical protein